MRRVKCWARHCWRVFAFCFLLLFGLFFLSKGKWGLSCPTRGPLVDTETKLKDDFGMRLRVNGRSENMRPIKNCLFLNLMGIKVSRMEAWSPQS